MTKAKAPAPVDRIAALADRMTSPQERARQAAVHKEATKTILCEDFVANVRSENYDAACKILQGFYDGRDRAAAWSRLSSNDVVALVRACPQALALASVPGGLDRLAVEMIKIDLLEVLPDLVWVSGPSQKTTAGGGCTEEQAEFLAEAGLSIDTRNVTPTYGHLPVVTAPVHKGEHGWQFPPIPVNMVAQTAQQFSHSFRGYPFGGGARIREKRVINTVAGPREIEEEKGEAATSIPHLVDRSVVDLLREIDLEFRRCAIVSEVTDDQIRQHLKVEISQHAQRVGVI